MDPHLTQNHLGRGQPPYKVASYSIQPFGHNGHGPKIGEWAVPLLGELGPHLTQCGRAEAYLHAKFHLGPSNRLAQYTNVTDKQDNGLIATA